MDDRNNRYGRSGSDQNPDYGSGRDYTYSSARDYAAAGVRGGERQERGDYGRRGSREDRWNERSGYGGQTRDWGGGEHSTHGGTSYGGGGFDPGYGEGRGYDRSRYGAHGGGDGIHRDRGGDFRGSPRDYDRDQDRSGNRSYSRDHDQHQDRGFFERAGDEVRSWFGDEDAEQRRERDQRYDERQGNSERWADRSKGDDHYHQWRRQRIAELDRDYDEYRRENAQRFHNEFSNWRTERQGQRDSLGRVVEHMDVVGSDGTHVGTVDKVRGDRIILTKSDVDAGGHHHSIPSRWVETVDTRVTLRKTADEAKAHWKDEEGSAELSGDDQSDARDNNQNWRSGGNLNRSFSGTY